VTANQLWGPGNATRSLSGVQADKWLSYLLSPLLANDAFVNAEGCAHSSERLRTVDSWGVVPKLGASGDVRGQKYSCYGVRTVPVSVPSGKSVQ